jgi:cytochrome c oxidase subunit 2
MIDQYVASASSFAPDIDRLILLILLVVGFWFLLAEAIFLGLIFKYSAKEGVKALYISGEDPKEKRWVAVPHYLTLIFDVLIIISALRVWSEVKMTMPQADETVRVIAQQWAWSFVHPGPDNVLDTADDITTVNELHVAANTLYHYKLESLDVLHNFSVPVFRLKQDAIPGRIITGWFEPTLTGTFDIQCAEICGIGHGLMPAKIVIESSEQHAAWVEQNSPFAVAALASN